jgi:hypothetical protein
MIYYTFHDLDLLRDAVTDGCNCRSLPMHHLCPNEFTVLTSSITTTSPTLAANQRFNKLITGKGP